MVLKNRINNENLVIGVKTGQKRSKKEHSYFSGRFSFLGGENNFLLSKVAVVKFYEHYEYVYMVKNNWLCT